MIEIHAEPSDILSDLELSPSRRHRGPPWMLTFIDLLSLLLTFFVMLFATQAVDRAKWQEVAEPAARLLNPGRPVLDVVGGIEYSVPRVDPKPALDLGYLATVLKQTLDQSPVLSQTLLRRAPDRLILTLPSDLLFAPLDITLDTTARNALAALSAVLKQLPNRIDVAGHTDPTPIKTDGRSNAISSNWELSLRRALAISAALQSTGYSGPLTAVGYADSRFSEIDPVLPLTDRYRLARRVDIVIRDFAPE